ncbi:SDR family NAD(P)-dependent oxidoreductase [Kordiimonas sp.]|uniref:SDR family NAD(P)-dependent oxidoreductase n=1 Tax=Kordiimonas sp. TaxID=1970157 RepID=UPI003A9134FE
MTDREDDYAAAIVIGASGGIGRALADLLDKRWTRGPVLRLSRNLCKDAEQSYGSSKIDITDEASVAAAAASLKVRDITPGLIFVATGVLQHGPVKAEKSLRDLDPVAMQQTLMTNTIGPALVMKHFLPLLPRKHRSVFAALSARVGSIGDNRLGGWYSYRASKAALNQLVHTAAIELKRRAPKAICVAVHPGTVDTALTRAFTKTGLEVQTPATAAGRILSVLEGLTPEQSGCFFDHLGKKVEW